MKPFLIGIAGGTGSGKTTVARRIYDSLHLDSAVFIDYDAYYKELGHLSLEEDVPLDRVHLLQSDTAAVSYDRSTGASRTTTLMGLAIGAAAKDARAQLVQWAQETLAPQFEGREKEISAAFRSVTKGEEAIFAAKDTSAAHAAAGTQRAHGAGAPGLGFDAPYGVVHAPKALAEGRSAIRPAFGGAREEFVPGGGPSGDSVHRHARRRRILSRARSRGVGRH